MLSNLPPLLQQQTLYSWCGLTHAWNGLSAAALSRQLFGAPRVALMHDFPASLDTFVERTEGRFGSAQYVAQRHTLLGYFLPLVRVELAGVILRRVREGAMPELKMKLGITASRIGGRHPLKGCFECFADDEASVGFAYWRLQHQFPSVMVCERHERPLTIAWDPVTPVHRRHWLLPRSGLKRQWIEVAVADRVQMKRLLQLAAFSSRFCMLPPSSLDSVCLARTYQTALKGIGLATSRGSLRLAALVRMTRSHYHGIETVPGFEALQSVTPDWPGLAGALARQSPKPGHPLKHLLLIAMLFDTWESFWATYKACAEPAAAPPQVAGGDPYTARMALFEDLVTTEGLSIRTASPKVGISVTTGVKWAKQLSVPYRTRAKTFSAGTQAAVRRLLKRGSDIAVVARGVGASTQSIRRLLAREEGVLEAWKFARFVSQRKLARRHFERLVNRNPGLTTKELRRIPGNCYMWLYRHDRSWLMGHLPAIWLVSRAAGGGRS